MQLTSRFQEAVQYALTLHQQQERKGSGVPYAAHLLGTASIVLELGGNETQAIAALLHDAVEDQGGLERLKEIELLFGVDVAAIVKDCTDAFVQPKPPWGERKEMYLTSLENKPADSLLVSCADKIYNALSILKDYQQQGEALWQRFTGRRDGTLWYYDQLAERFCESLPGPASQYLKRVVDALNEALYADIRLKTERLILLALNPEKLEALIKWQESGYGEEEKLTFNPLPDMMNEDVREISDFVLADMLNDSPEQRLWKTFWIMIDKTNHEGIGLLGFKGKPENGAVEIGYGIAPSREGKGFISEAVKALSKWGLQQPDCDRITAETEKDNTGSMRVLEKCGYKKTGENDELILWELIRPN